jgi:small subunit ribosomal protein S10
LIDKCVKEIIDAIRKEGAIVKGPVPLPTKVVRITVLRSPHTDKRSREQFEMRTHKRIIEITEASSRVMDKVTKLIVPSGVEIKVETFEKK